MRLVWQSPVKIREQTVRSLRGMSENEKWTSVFMHLPLVLSPWKKIPVEIPFLTFMHTFIRSTCTAQLSLFFATNLAITRYCETQSNLLHSNARPLCTLPICQWSPLNSASRLLMWATVCLTVRAATRFEKAGSNHLRFNELTISLLIIQAWPSWRYRSYVSHI